MSGPEWTNDDPESRDDARPITSQAGFDQNQVQSFAQAHAQPPEPAMDHDHDSPDHDEPAPVGPSEATPPPKKRPSFVAMVLSLASKIPLPSLGSERHEMMPDASPGPENAAHARPKPKKALARIPFLALNRETRVGIAALLSFVVLVTSLCFNKGWIGRKPVTVALAGPPDGAPGPTVPDKKDEAKSPKGEPKNHDKDEKSVPTPEPGEGTKAPEPTPVTPPGLEPRLGDPVGSEPAALPPPTTESSNPPVLGSDPSPTPTPPPLPSPESSTPRPLEPPPTANDPPVLPEPTPTLPAPAATPDRPPPAQETKPTEPEVNPTPAPNTGPPPVGNPPAMTPPGESTQAPPVVAETAPPPIPTPTPEPVPAPPPTPTPTPVVSAGPVPTEKPPTLETVPATPAVAIEPAATRASTVGALGASWISIPSGGRRIVGSVPIVSTPAEAQVDTLRVADGPRVVDDPTAADQVEPVVHVVRPGENFWTISKLYYREGRFYKALHAANRKQVPDIRQLWVGTVLRIPPPEALDRSLIDPAGRSNSDASTSTVSRTSKSKQSELAAEQADLAMPARPRLTRPDPEAVAAPRRPTYKVKPHETLRSIARDTLNDPRRDREIYNLNRDVLDDINVLPAGTTLTLPEDATVGRRASK